MGDWMKVEADKERMLQAIAKVGDKARMQVHAASLETAKRVADEMRRRIARSAGPWKSGDVPTHTKIHYEEARARNGNPWGEGYVVMAYDTGGAGTGGRTRQFHTDIWLEHGTVNMAAQPFLWASAQTEEGPHRRRMEEALFLQQFLDGEM